MDSSPVLRQQNKNKIQSDHMRTKNELNKMPSGIKPHMSKPGIENKAPGTSGSCQNAPFRPGISRLPVLAKSLHLETASDFTQTHKQWEEKPLRGKTKSKKPCTKPMPFNFSQPRTRTAALGQRPSTAATVKAQTQAAHNGKNLSCVHLITKKVNTSQSAAATNKDRTNFAMNQEAQPSAPQHFPTRKAVVSLQHNDKATCGAEVSQGVQLSSEVSSGTPVPTEMAKALVNTIHGSGLPRHNAVHHTSVTSIRQAAECQASTEACLNDLDLLSLRGPSKTLPSNKTVQAASCVNVSSSLTGKEVFQPDHAALLSILKNEGIGRVASATKPSNYLPQRVSVMKRQNPGPTTGQPKSPDRFALQDTLLIESGMAGSATPRNSVCPRGTSVYTAQRVPVAQSHFETAAGQMVKETLMKWTPQRVPVTRHQPMSSITSTQRRILSTLQTPYTSCSRLGVLQGHSTELGTQKEEVVQRLFGDQEDEQPEADQLPGQGSIPQPEPQEVISRSHGEAEEQRSTGGQPFFQEPHRESVIFFSTGKKLFRAPRVEALGRCVQPEQSTAAGEALVPTCTQQPACSKVTGQANLLSLHGNRGLMLQKKSGTLSPAVAMLRKRLPPLDELRLDEEVSIYTSGPAPLSPAVHTLRPRCGNPMASVLHYHESARFVPIGCENSPGSSSICTSPVWERELLHKIL